MRFRWREKFDAGTERQYLEESAARSGPFIQGTLVLLIAFYLVIGWVGDDHIADMDRGQILSLRIPLLVVLFGSLAASMSNSSAIRPDTVLALVIATASVTSSWVATLDPDASFRVVASHLGFSIIAVTVASSFNALVVITLFILIVPNAIFGVYLQAGGLLPTANLFLIFGACLILFLGYMADHRRRQLFRVTTELTRIARIDGLTDISNRRFFIETAEVEVLRSRRYRYPFACMILDIDHFKKINDSLGHQAGNVVLKEMARASGCAVREIDLLGRLGGDEFAIALPETDLDEALWLAERIRRELAALDVVAGGRRVAFTVSIGVAALASTDESIMAVLKRADEALYRAKKGGRNRAVVASFESETPPHGIPYDAQLDSEVSRADPRRVSQHV